MTPRACPSCHGTGYVVQEKEGRLVAATCSCRNADRISRLVARAGIPQRYRNACVFETFRPRNASQEKALLLARKYAEDFPAFPRDRPSGLLFMGPCGVGKTHLAVSVLQELLLRKGIPVLFADLNELYREIWASYGRREAGETEYDILAPLVEAPLLLIDELGCRDSAWAQDTLLYLVSQRHSELRPTLCTTNYLDAPASGEASLESRIGVRARSRLLEMCLTVSMDGQDYRRK
ncbi:MAG: ATP-binding protein [Acidobacteriota bacterium]